MQRQAPPTQVIAPREQDPNALFERFGKPSATKLYGNVDPLEANE